MAGPWKPAGKIGHIHTGIFHNGSISNCAVVGRSDSLSGNGDAQYFVSIILLIGNKILDFRSNLFIVSICIFIRKWNGIHAKRISV